MNARALGLRALIAFSLAIALAAPAQAYLGSFEINDGYNVQSGFIGGDVSYYNAGAHGPNAGGGSLTQTLPNAGLWDIVPASQPGGYYASAALRAVATAAAPIYPNPAPGSIGAYIVGNHGMGRNMGTCLAIRNDTPAGTGSMIYDYTLDSFDFGGVAPLSVTGTIPIQWYFCPNPGDSANSGSKIGDKFSLTFRDSAGNTGFQWGYDRANGVYWRLNSSLPWNTTSIVADSMNWDGVKVNLNLTNDTFSMDYYDISANAWSNVVPAGTALNMPMSNLTALQWELVDDLSAGQGGKNFFDDFSFFVPEPSALSLAALAACAAFRRRRS